MVSSHHFFLVLLNHFKLDTLFLAILIIFNDVFIEGALLIGDDNLAVFYERELMFVGKQILVFDFFGVEVLDNKLLLIAILCFLFKRFLQDYNQPIQFEFQLFFDKLNQTLYEPPLSFVLFLQIVDDIFAENDKRIFLDVPFYIFIQGVFCPLSLVVNLKTALFT